MNHPSYIRLMLIVSVLALILIWAFRADSHEAGDGMGSIGVVFVCHTPIGAMQMMNFYKANKGEMTISQGWAFQCYANPGGEPFLVHPNEFLRTVDTHIGIGYLWSVHNKHTGLISFTILNKSSHEKFLRHVNFQT